MRTQAQVPMKPETQRKDPYKPLKDGEIRLLELLPDATHLTGKLQHWQTEGDLDDRLWKRPPSYTALSHHWDPKSADESKLPVLILLDPEDPQNLYELRLRPSLYHGLQAIRERMNHHPNWQKKGWTRHIWIDAICIDQKSPSDKDMQLGKMGDIYNDAQAVVVWLGLLDGETQNAMAFVRELQELSSLNKFIKDERYADKWKSLVILVRKPWFRRLWIVQELAAARDAELLAGDQSVSWDDFASAWSIFVSQFEQVRTMLAKAGFFAKVRDPFGDIKLSGADILVNNRGTLLRKRQDGGIAEHLRPLEYLLTSMSMFEVTEPHDIVYAILWLSSDASQGKKRGYTMSHEWNRRTPRPEEMRRENRMQYQPRENTNGFLSPTNTTSTRRRKQSISEQFAQIPATYLEQQQADEHTILDSGIKINYKQPVFDLCSQVLTHIIKTTQRLDIICFHWAPPPRETASSDDEKGFEPEEDHPTWLLYTQRDSYSNVTATERLKPEDEDAPAQLNSVNQRINADPLVGTPGSNRRPYLACGRTRATDVRIHGRVLQVCGFVLAKIDVDAGTAYDAVIPWAWRRELDWTDNAEPPPDRFWRTLVADKALDGQPPPPRFRLACKWAFELPGQPPMPKRRRINRSSGPNLNLEKVRNSGDGEAPLKEFLDRAIATTWNRKLFKTQICGDPTTLSADAAFVGLGPQDLQRGDVVCVILGCAVPIILRPSPEHYEVSSIPTIVTNAPLEDEPKGLSTPNDQGGKKNLRLAPIKVGETPLEHYTFVGECYVHGMMNGEIFNWADSYDRRLQDFYLR